MNQSVNQKVRILLGILLFIIAIAIAMCAATPTQAQGGCRPDALADPECYKHHIYLPAIYNGDGGGIRPDIQ